MVCIAFHFPFTEFEKYCNCDKSAAAYLFAKISLEIKRIIDQYMCNSDMLIFAASGNSSNRRGNQFVTTGLPALVDPIFSIGNLKRTSDNKYTLYNSSNSMVDFVLPGEDCLAAFKAKGTIESGGTSAATANAVGICALLLQKIRSKPNGDNSQNNLLDILKNSSSTSDIQINGRYINPQFHYGNGLIIAPQKSIIKPNTMTKKAVGPGTPHTLKLKNNCHINVRVEVWNKSTDRRSGGDFENPHPDQPSKTGPEIIIKAGATEPVTIYEDSTVDIIVLKQDQRVVSDKVQDYGLTFEITYIKEGEGYIVEYIISSTEIKLSEIDHGIEYRYSYRFLKNGPSTGSSHHIAGNIGHPGGGNP